jgi:tellurite resistance protein TerC
LPRAFRHENLPAVTTSIWFWVAFHIGVFAAIGIDLVSFKQRGRELSMRAAAQRSALWVLVSLGFNALVWRLKGPQHALDFLTGYLIEYSMSVDNIFVFVLIFAHFRVPPLAQHRALVWGIVGALVMRGIMIGCGIALVQRFRFVPYLFGVFLLVVAVQMFFGKHPARDFAETWVMRMCRRIFPVTREFYGEHFKARVGDRWMLTPLALAMIVIEITDIIFAVDSIPAVFAITRDPFIVYTSNICAVLGLRSLYFLVARLMNRFVYLRTGLAFVLAFVGIKMITADYYPLPKGLSLGIIVLILAITVVVSMLRTQNRTESGNQK